MIPMFLSERVLDPERMDVEPLDLDSTARILRALEKINVWLGGVRATLSRLEEFARKWRTGERIRFIDWGTGGADIPRALVRWGRSRGFSIEVVGLDNNAPVIDYSRRACREFPEIQLLQADFNEFPDLAPGSYDYAISSLCLHHLREAEIITLLKKSDRLCRRGMIMNDLKRSERAWVWIWMLSRLLPVHPIVRNDGPLSIRRAFTNHELQNLAVRAGLDYLKVETHFGYRLTLSGEKPSIFPSPQKGEAIRNVPL